jgi:hypothetical protein
MTAAIAGAVANMASTTTRRQRGPSPRTASSGCLGPLDLTELTLVCDLDN